MVITRLLSDLKSAKNSQFVRDASANNIADLLIYGIFKGYSDICMSVAISTPAFFSPLWRNFNNEEHEMGTRSSEGDGLSAIHSTEHLTYAQF